MAAYVASARIDRGRPRMVAPARPPAEPADGRGVTAPEPWLLDTSPPDQRDLELRWESVRERWSQLWFFVLDPESWR